MHMLQLLKIVYLILTFQLQFACFSGKKRQINIGFFLNEKDDGLNDVIIKSSTNIINRYMTKNRFNIHVITYKIENEKITNLGNVACNMLEEGVAAIFGPLHPSTNPIVQSIAQNHEIPQFQPFPNPTLREYRAETGGAPFNFNLHPASEALSSAFATLVRENDWKGYTIIYEEDEGLVRLQEVLRGQNSKESAVTYRKLKPGGDHRPILKDMVADGAVHFILDCSVDHIIPILLQAKEVKLLEEYHSYILTALDAYTVDFSTLGQIRTNISLVRLLDDNRLNEVIGNWELAYSGSYNPISARTLPLQSALLYDALNLFISAFSQLDSTEELLVRPLSCNLYKTHEISTHGYRLAALIALQNMTQGDLVGPISGPIAFNQFGERTTFKLQIIELTNQQFRTTGIWDTNHPSDIYSTITSEEREKEQFEQLKGKNFRVVSRVYPPYLSRKSSTDGNMLQGNDAIEGYALDLIHGVCLILNCTYTFELVPDNNYGKYDSKTKEWNGLIRHLLDRKADLAVCDLTTTYERRKAVDFTNPFMTLGISILYAKVVKEPPELLAFTNPLSLDVWLYTATAYMLISMIIFLVARLNPSEWENPHPCETRVEQLENIWNIKNCFWLTLGSIMAQGCDLLPKGISTRMVAGMWWFFSLIMTACYTANLAAFLTQERMGPTIQSADDLAAQTKIKYGCVRNGATASFFEDSNITTFHKMWVQMMSADPSVFEKSNDDGVKRVISSKGKYAFLMESSSIEYEIEKNCGLVQVGNWLDTKGYGIAMPTNAPYRTAINQAILKMQEQGTLHRLKERWWKEKNKGTPCKKDDILNEATAAELGLPHVGGVFVVLAGGISVALIIAVFEFLWNVKKVAINQHMTLEEALVKELKFAANVTARRKRVPPNAND